MSEKTNPSIKTLALLIPLAAAALAFSCGSGSGSSKSQVNPHAEAHKQMHDEFYREEQARDRVKALERIAGSFSGKLPCGDCEGIQFELKLNAGIDRHTPVGFEPPSDVSLRTNLELMLTSVSAGVADLGYSITDGVIVIATKDALPKRFQTRIYDITDLSSSSADYYSATTGGIAGQNR